MMCNQEKRRMLLKLSSMVSVVTVKHSSSSAFSSKDRFQQTTPPSEVFFDGQDVTEHLDEWLLFYPSIQNVLLPIVEGR